MGGDYAPQAVVSGAVLAAGLIAPQSKIVLFGDRPSIEELLAKENFRADAFDIVHTTQVIEMGDNPALTFRQKPDSSIAVGFRHLTEGRIDGFASAGSTGAMMVGCMYTVKQIEGIIRPAISSVIPTIDGGSVMLLDVGLNVDCKPEVLYQYAVIGNLYAQGVLGKKEPRIALLNIGEEKEKGNLQTKAAYELMDGSADFRFVGNIEAKHISRAASPTSWYATDSWATRSSSRWRASTTWRSSKGFAIPTSTSSTTKRSAGLRYWESMPPF